MKPQPRKPVRPAVPSVARRMTALKDAERRLRRWPREETRPSCVLGMPSSLGVKVPCAT
jgi:hypothetical protein